MDNPQIGRIFSLLIDKTVDFAAETTYYNIVKRIHPIGVSVLRAQADGKCLFLLFSLFNLLLKPTPNAKRDERVQTQLSVATHHPFGGSTIPQNVNIPDTQRVSGIFGGQGWIRTTEVGDDRFTVCSLWPLGNLSVYWSWRLESNPQPADYKSAALPIELHQQYELMVP